MVTGDGQDPYARTPQLPDPPLDAVTGFETIVVTVDHISREDHSINIVLQGPFNRASPGSLRSQGPRIEALLAEAGWQAGGATPQVDVSDEENVGHERWVIMEVTPLRGKRDGSLCGRYVR